MSLDLEALAAADGRVLDRAELLLDTVEILPSPVALLRLREEAASARGLARASAARTHFDRLLLRHLVLSWEALETLVRYRFEWPRLPVRDLLDAVAGAGALDRLEGVLAGVDHDEVWAYLDLRQRFRAGRVPPSAPEARPLLEKAVEEMAAAFKAWLAAREGALPGLDAAVVLGAPQAERSFYEPARHRVEIGPHEFMIFRDGGAMRVNSVTAILGLAHELAGHAVQDALSRGLPDPLRPDHRSRLRIASLPASEGFAYHRAALAVPFAEEHRSMLALQDQDIDLLRRMVRMSGLHHAIPACVGALAARARQEPGFDAAARLGELSGHAGFGEMLARTAEEPVNRVLYNAACFLGLEAVREAAAALEARGVSGAGAVRRLGTGGWSLACYREAVTREDTGGPAAP